MSKSEFNFLTSPTFKNVTILAWDPTNYTATLDDWLKRPEFNLFPKYVEFRKKFPKSKVFILNPLTIWRVWDFLQKNAPDRLRRNPPSSGFLGEYVLIDRSFAETKLSIQMSSAYQIHSR